MTQTSLTQGELLTLLNSAYDLHGAIGLAMDAIKNNDGPGQPDEWSDLKIAFDAAHIAAEQIYQMVKRQRAADQPIPYTLAEQ